MRPPASTYEQQGFSKQQAKRWQDVADIPRKDFDAHLAGLRRSGERVTMGRGTFTPTASPIAALRGAWSA